MACTMMLQINEAGRRFLRLLKEEWWTNGTFRASGLDNTFELRGFHREYEAVVKLNNDIIQKIELILKKGEDLIVDIEI